ncbi:MAG: FHA domain-containing protein [bacterium]
MAFLQPISSQNPIASASSVDANSLEARFSQQSLNNLSSSLTRGQAQIDQMVGHFNEEATRGSLFLAMGVGGAAFRLGRMGSLALSPANPVASLFSYGTGLVSEVAAFESTQRAFASFGSENHNPNLWRWSGGGGWGENFASNLLTFGVLRGFGGFTQGSNLFVQHATQSSAVVAGQQLAYRLGWTERPEGSLTEQLLRAETTNLHMLVGGAVFARVFPALHQVENALELSLRGRAPLARNPLDGSSRLFEEALAMGDPTTLETSSPEASDITSLASRPMAMMSLGEIFGWVTGASKPPSSPAPAIETSVAENRSTPPPPTAQPMAYFQSPFDASEVFPLGRLNEGQSITLGRTSSKRTNIFPDFYRHISRQHLDFRIRNGQMQVKPHEGATEVRINQVTLSPFLWYPLRHGDLIELVEEGRQDLENPENISARPMVNSSDEQPPLDPTYFPAVFWFLEAGSSVPISGPRSDRPIPVSLTLHEILTELHRFSENVKGVYNLSTQVIQNQWETVQQDPDTYARTLVDMHKPFCGTAVRRTLVEMGRTKRNVEFPLWDGVLRERLSIYEASLQNLPNTPEAVAARMSIAQLRDDLGRFFITLRNYRRVIQTPVGHLLMDSIERAYAGLQRDSSPPEAQVRSQTRSLDLTVSPSDRQAWIDAFLANVMSPRITRNAQILMGSLTTVLDHPVGGSFYRALSDGTIYEGLRSVRAYFDTQTGDIVAFRDESPESIQALSFYKRQGRKIGEASILVNVVRSGRIEEVGILTREVRDSVSMGLLGLQGLQVLPEHASNPPPPLPPPTRIFGTTERDLDGEAWALEFPAPPDTEKSQLLEVVGVAPYQPSAGQNGVPRLALVTLEPKHPQEGGIPLQLWTSYTLVEHLLEGTKVRVQRR